MKKRSHHWSAKEDGYLKELLHAHGLHWKVVATHFESRSEDAIRKRYFRLFPKKIWDTRECQSLMDSLKATTMTPHLSNKLKRAGVSRNDIIQDMCRSPENCTNIHIDDTKQVSVVLSFL